MYVYIIYIQIKLDEYKNLLPFFCMECPGLGCRRWGVAVGVAVMLALPLQIPAGGFRLHGTHGMRRTYGALRHG